MKRLASLSVLGLLAMTTHAPAPTSAVIAAGGNTPMYDVFQDWCLKAPPSFTAIDSRAAQGHLRLLADSKSAQPDGTPVESKQWQFDKNSATFAIAAISSGKDGAKTDACTVLFGSLPDSTMPAFLSQDSRLGAPLAQSPDKRMTRWKGPFPGTVIQLDLQSAGQFVQAGLTLLQTEPVH